MPNTKQAEEDEEATEIAEPQIHQEEGEAYASTESPAKRSSPRKRTASERQEEAQGQDEGVNDDADEDDEDGAEGAKKKARTASRRKSVPPPKKLNNEQWDGMFDRLIEYKNDHGDCLVPKRYASDPKLGTWVETQRVQYKKLQNTGAVTPNKRLNAERLQRLESIGFAWSAKNRKTKPAATPAGSAKTRKTPSSSNPDAAARAAARQLVNDAQWNDMYERLVQYKEKNGDCLVPKKFEEDTKLATWVETQRVLYNRDYRKPAEPEPTFLFESPPAAVEGKTPEEWAEELESATGGATDDDPAVVAATMEAAAMAVVDEVTAAETPDVADVVAAIEGTTAESKQDTLEATENAQEAAPGEVADAFTPGRTTKRLTQERKDKLDALGFVWSVRSKRVDDHWDEMFQQLVEYKNVHGDCLVPSRFEENFKLGKWVETQRYEYTKLQRAAGQTEEKTAEKSEDGKAKASRPTNPRLTEERLRRLESIGFEWKVKNKMKRYYDRQWDSMFEKLLEYKEEHGHCLVPKRYPPDMKLGTWVHTQRIQYRKFLAGTSAKKEDTETAETATEDSKMDEEVSFRLTEARRKRLEEAGFVWSARETEKTAEPSRITRNSYDDQWDAMFDRLAEYKQKHGNCLVPKRCKEDPKLGTWVDTQRVQYKKMTKQLSKQGIKWEGPAPARVEGDEEAKDGAQPPNTTPKPVVGRLTDDRIRRLESLGFVWSLRDDWHKHYEELIEYKKENGHCNVPARYQQNRRLGIWVSAQRQQFKIMNMPDDQKPRRSAPLTTERVNLLNELGFTWTIRSRDSLGESWNQRLAELKQYKAENGTCLVPSRHPPNPELGVWVGTQRTQYRLYMKAKEMGTAVSQSSAMNEERIQQLEDLGFIWALRGTPDSLWRKRVGELVEYRAANGNCAIPSKYKHNAPLGSWAADQRAQYKLKQEGKPSSLDDEKVAELDSLGFCWDEPEELVSDASVTQVAGVDNSQMAATATASALAAATVTTEEGQAEPMDLHPI